MRFTTKTNPIDNNGIKLRFYFGKVCYLFPSMVSRQTPFYRKSCFIDSLIRYELSYQKIFFWFWFRFSVTLYSLETKMIPNGQLSEKFFNMLPPSIHIVGEIYYLNIVKSEFVSVFYSTKDGEKTLLDGPIIGKTLTEVFEKMVHKLKESDNVRFMRYNYKKLFEDHFNMEVPQERKFEPYYE